MKASTKSVLNVAGAGALALVMATSAFAAPQRGNQDSNRGREESRGSQDRGRGNDDSYRDNQRVNASGRVTSLSRANGGYRVQLDRGRESYWIPESRMRNRGSDLRVGISIVLGGVFRGGRVDVDAVSWPDDLGYRDERGYRNDRDYRDDYVRGIVERIDYRSGVLLLRDASSRRTIEVDMRDTRRSSRIDLGDLRRGDSVTLSGQWLRSGRFEADDIESVNSRR
jgi:hypothetical protein